MKLNKYIPRKCGYCGTTKSSIGRKTRGKKRWVYTNWVCWDGILACMKCYKKRYDQRKKEIRGPVNKKQKLDGIERKCVICGSTTTRIAGTPRCSPYPRWFCYNGGAICYRCKLRLLSRIRAREAGIPERKFHDDRPLVDLIRKCPTYLKWVKAVLERDNYRCRDCQGEPRLLQAHHIKPFLEILQENGINTLEKALACEKLWDVSNGMTLCKPCHRKRDPRRRTPTV